jgi:LmbE family N-acetylglucosaminyl deacetylase
MDNILVIAPHPDDETIGCGGTLLKHKDNGDRIFWMILTSMHHNNEWSVNEIERRKQEIKEVAEKFQFSDVFELDYSAKELDLVPMSEIVSKISKVVNKIHPTIVYLPNPTDVHTDHQVAFKAGYSCTKVFRFPFVKKVLAYETLSETDFSANLSSRPFSPNVFIDISDYIDQKINIMRVYKDQMETRPFPRSEDNIFALATLRGGSSNCYYAEGFQLVKSIE